ncbi:expressed unknown protein [Seminavis robusta]|uniref:Uncharacterized protein n=1 Tax=Seminavis robusta TaxID=568900 RepID=A0A9N8ENQ7_9STRA|nr:expressed unknown protein [Seminavis robusta]|eukprot:Sro1296_g260380.1 n/a (376) ;mRNA; f:16216-17623
MPCCGGTKAGGGALLRSVRSLRVLPPYPLSRFQDWASLGDATQMAASDILDYDEKSWNRPGENKIEELSFETITLEAGLGEDVEKQFDETAVGVIMNDLNFTEEQVWDCWVNHYQDYFWEELEEVAVATYFEDLGWNRHSFEDDDPPESDDMEWFQLTDKEKLAAEALCYFPELWAGDVDIADWENQPAGAGVNRPTSVGNQTWEERPGIFPWSLPLTRLTVWEALSAVEQTHATTLGFNESTWNSPGTAAIETSFDSFDELSAANKSAAEGLGIDEFFWDCLIQHYSNRGWNQLQALGVQDYFLTLDWTFASWHDIVPPPATDSMSFADLTMEQQEAAEQLCYLPETYPRGGDLFNINLQSFSEPPSAAPSVAV